MSENTTKKTEDTLALSQNEKLEFLKALFNSLEIDNKAIHANWCHEQVEKGAGEFLGEKMYKMNEQMNSFISKAYDKVIKTGTQIYDKTNEAFAPSENIETENKDKNTSKGSEIFD